MMKVRFPENPHNSYSRMPLLVKADPAVATAAAAAEGKAACLDQGCSTAATASAPTGIAACVIPSAVLLQVQLLLGT
jgi:hypothetical protein